MSGISYHRARWYDARNASWLSEDPLNDVDSPNIYAFVAWEPHMARDPLGLQNPRMDLWAQSGAQLAEEDPEAALHLTTSVTGFFPVVGDVQDFGEAFSGRSLATGEQLSTSDRVVTAVGFAMPLVPGKVLRGVKAAVGGVWGWVRRGRRAADEMVAGVDEVAETVEETLDTVDELAETSKTRVPRGKAAVDDLLSSASQADRGGFTRAGRSLTKHGQGAREGNRLFPQARGNPGQINRQAQSIVEEILGNPETTVLRSSRGRFGDTVEYIAPDGRGLVYDAQGNFLFFRE